MKYDKKRFTAMYIRNRRKSDKIKAFDPCQTRLSKSNSKHQTVLLLLKLLLIHFRL